MSRFNPRVIAVEGGEEEAKRILKSNLREKRDVRSHVNDKKVVEVKKMESKLAEDINESADAFIKRFRQQLHLQRLESMENYKEMLARGL
ncbi:hypothetical protein HHK36_013974 [Tetracentron sinense]|uniref:Uncharacterized protein n=1 Tax=Tetracentron sinense TaxID=13715 RepID=A0A834Z334_TETSI|nr:hypothetical protein HHK36_013974 [Tetracentron sinense]